MMEIQLRHAMSGTRSRIAHCRQERDGRVTSVRNPMPFKLYKKLCELAMKKGGRNGNFLYTYMVMTWNLACHRQVLVLLIIVYVSFNCSL
jgi:hypothetical protein